MKVKLYELLRMLYEGEVRNRERVIIDNMIYKIDKKKKSIYKYMMSGVKDRLWIWVDELDKECELIDRK